MTEESKASRSLVFSLGEEDAHHDHALPNVRGDPLGLARQQPIVEQLLKGSASSIASCNQFHSNMGWAARDGLIPF